MYTESFYAPKISETHLGEHIGTTHGVTQGRGSSTSFFSFYVSDMPSCLENINTNDFFDPFNLLQLADDTTVMADKLESLRLKFVALFSYSSRKYQIPNIKKTYYAHFATNPSTTSLRINNNIFISSIDKTKGHVYLGMLFIPTDEIRNIVIVNINNRMKHIAKYYAWLDINENTSIETKILVLDNCCFNALLYACEVWGDVSYIESRLSTLETKLLNAFLTLKKAHQILSYFMNLGEQISYQKSKIDNFSSSKK